MALLDMVKKWGDGPGDTVVNVEVDEGDGEEAIVDEGDGNDVAVAVSVDVSDGNAVGDVTVVFVRDSASFGSTNEGYTVVDDDDGDGEEVM
eukprot:12001575-Ditylum_brightwellii.AAC.1